MGFYDGDESLNNFEEDWVELLDLERIHFLFFEVRGAYVFSGVDYNLLAELVETFVV